MTIMAARVYNDNTALVLNAFSILSVFLSSVPWKAVLSNLFTPSHLQTPTYSQFLDSWRTRITFQPLVSLARLANNLMKKKYVFITSETVCKENNPNDRRVAAWEPFGIREEGKGRTQNISG